MKATEQYFSVVLFIMQWVVLSFESVGEILKLDHSNESYWAVLSCGAVYYAVGGSIFWVCGWNPKVWPFKWKLLSSTFLWCLYTPDWKNVAGKKYKLWTTRHYGILGKMSISFILSVPFWCARCLRIKAGSSASQKTIGSYSLWFMLFTWQRFFN